MFEVREYLDAAERSPFAKWLRALNVQAAAKVATGLERIADGNLSNAKAVGHGVMEYKVDFGPGYRIYFGRDGDRLVEQRQIGQITGSGRARRRGDGIDQRFSRDDP